MKLKDWLEAVDYRITEGGDYYWSCYGDSTYQLTVAFDDDHDRYASCVFDNKTMQVFDVQVTINDKCYRWIHPPYRNRYEEESRSHGLDPQIAYDSVKFIDLELGQDILEKTRAILRGEPYDERVQIEIDLSEEEQFRLMQLAHERDITLNQMVTELIQEVIDQHEPTVNKANDDWEFA